MPCLGGAFFASTQITNTKTNMILTRLMGRPLVGLVMLWLSSLSASAAVTFADIAIWTGAPQTATTAQAALVIDWSDGQAPLVWGYRWEPADGEKTGRDMLTAILGADNRLTAQGTNFLSDFSWDANTDGTPERFKPGWNGSEYWAYFVNNDVYYHPTNFLLNGHIIPPATTVVPNGNPYSAMAPGTWVSSSTGVVQRPLVNGSWDGFVYNTGITGPLEPVAASPVPEPSTSLLALGLTMLLGRRRAVS
jgi:hypothetical protein